MKISTNFLNLLKVCMCVVLAFAALETRAQGESFTVSGTVKDASGQPVIGATVFDTTTRKGDVTSTTGSFSLQAAPGSVLRVSFVGYAEQSAKVVAGKTTYDFVLESDALEIEELVVVGYGTQKKASLTGAISAINNEEIITTKNENVQNMLTGKVAGLRVRQNSSEPGQFNTSMDIRGFGAPLIVIDGVPRDNMARLDPEDIEQVSVLKDASAAIYGVKGGNGVVLITTKKGDKGRVNINYSGNISWQRPSNFPDLVDAADWMTLYNEKYTMHSVDNMSPVPQYSQEDIAAYRNGEKKSYNWKDAVFRNSAPKTQHTVSASGGNDKVTFFYTSLGYQYQESFLQHTPITYDKYTLRANINAKIAKNLTLDVNLAGHMDEKKMSNFSSSDIVRSTWLFTPLDPFYYDDEQTMYHTKDDNTGIVNPLAMIDKDANGYQSLISRWFQSAFSLRWDMPFLPGLYAKGFFSYDYIMNDNKFYRKAFNTYTSTGAATSFLKGTHTIISCSATITARNIASGTCRWAMTAPSAVTPYRACCSSRISTRWATTSTAAAKWCCLWIRCLSATANAAVQPVVRRRFALTTMPTSRWPAVSTTTSAASTSPNSSSATTHRRASRRATCAGYSSPRYPSDGVFRRKTSGKSLRSTSLRI